MIGFLGGILEFALDMIEMALDLAFGAVELVFGILGGIASLLFSAVGVALVMLLAVVFIRRRRRRNEPRHDSDVLVDENGETFTSFYRRKEE